MLERQMAIAALVLGFGSGFARTLPDRITFVSDCQAGVCVIDEHRSDTVDTFVSRC